MKRAPFLGKKIVVFTAHPDDEQLAAGTMYENHRAGGQTFLICATAGEKGKSHLTKPVTDARLKKIRKEELLKAGKILKIDKIIFLEFPDATVRAHKKKLLEKSIAVIKKIKPDYILSFGPDGISAHWDHITVGEVARMIAKKLRVPLVAFTLHPGIAKERKKVLLARRKFGSYTEFIEHRVGDIRVPINHAIKNKAIAAHRSQFPGGSWIKALPAKAVRRFYRDEHFVNEKI